MFLTRKTSILWLAAVSALAMEGCATRGNSQPNVSVEPEGGDAAMVHRDWPQSVAAIPNGGTVAGSTGFAYQPRRGMQNYRYYYADSGVFMLNVITLPYTLYRDGVAQPQVYPGERTNPTFTAVPVLPVGNMPDPNLPPPAARSVKEAPPAVEEPAPVTPEPETPAPSENPPASNTPTETPAETPPEPPAGGSGTSTMGGT